MKNEFQYMTRPQVPLPGCLAQVIPYKHFSLLQRIEVERIRTTYTVRATIADTVPLALTVPEILALESNSMIMINGETQTVFLHHSGNNAVFYDMVPKPNGDLSHIDVQVAADRPLSAVEYGRTSINQLLDTLMREIWLPLSIVRLDVIHPDYQTPVMQEFHYPFLTKLNFGPMGGYDSFPLLAEYEAMAREAISTQSPYYRFLCSFRLCEAIKSMRSQIRKYVEHFNITEPMPKLPAVDPFLLTNYGFDSDYAQRFSKFDHLISNWVEQRNALSHALTRELGDRPLHLSLGSNYQGFSSASTVLLHYAHLAFDDLRVYFNVNVSSRLFQGSILPEIERRADFVVQAPHLYSKD